MPQDSTKTITFNCVGCGIQLTAPWGNRSRRFDCPKCGRTQTVPSESPKRLRRRPQ